MSYERPSSAPLASLSWPDLCWPEGTLWSTRRFGHGATPDHHVKKGIEKQNHVGPQGSRRQDFNS